MHGAFGESGGVGDCAHTGADRSPSVSRCVSVKVQVNYERGWLLIVPGQIAHQDVEHVVVDGHGAFEARHRGRMN